MELHLKWLGLEVKYLDRARAFYSDTLPLQIEDETDRRIIASVDGHAPTATDLGPNYARNGQHLVLRRPRSTPRGGLHTHYALSIPRSEYEDWRTRLERDFDLYEHNFGEMHSMYFYDPDGNCVELAGRKSATTGIDGVFEIVLEVADLEDAVNRYQALGFTPYDRSEERRRVRLAGPFDLELWEPHLGLADARGGAHVDLGFVVDSPEEAVDILESNGDIHHRERLHEDVFRVTDPDGHVLTFAPPASN